MNRICHACAIRPKAQGNRFLCNKCYENSGRDLGNLWENWDAEDKVATAAVRRLRKQINQKCKILTTDPHTLLRYPQAAVVSKRYIQKPRAYGPEGRFSS